MVEIIYDGSHAYVQNPDEAFESFLEKQLKFRLASIELQQKKSFAKSRDPNVWLYDRRTHSFPTGLVPRVLKYTKQRQDLPQLDIKASSEVSKAKASKLDLDQLKLFGEYNLWEHQKEAIEVARKSKRGVIQMPTGSGKTAVIAVLAKMFPDQQIIVVAPGTDVVKENKNDIEAVIDEEVGLLGDGKKKVKRVTCATDRSLVNIIEDDPDQVTDTSVLMFDECHLVGHNKTYWTISRALYKTRYRLGFSGTAWREQGDQLAMEGIIGPRVYDVSAEYLQRQGVLVEFDYIALPIEDDESIEYPKYDPTKRRYRTKDGKPERKDVYQTMVVEHEERNEKIVELVKRYYEEGCPYGPCLVLVELLEHADILYSKLSEHLTEQDEVELVKGQPTPKTKKKEVIKRLKSNDLPVCVASKVFSVGVDFPSAGFLVIAGGGNAASITIQKIGRIIRKAKDKDRALVVDFEDKERYYLRRNYNNRVDALKDQYPSTKVRKEDNVESVVQKKFQPRSTGT